MTLMLHVCDLRKVIKCFLSMSNAQQLSGAKRQYVLMANVKSTNTQHLLPGCRFNTLNVYA